MFLTPTTLELWLKVLRIEWHASVLHHICEVRRQDNLSRRWWLWDRAEIMIKLLPKELSYDFYLFCQASSLVFSGVEGRSAMWPHCIFRFFPILLPLIKYIITIIDFFGRIIRLRLSADFFQQPTFFYVIVSASHSDHATKVSRGIHASELTCSTELEIN